MTTAALLQHPSDLSTVLYQGGNNITVKQLLNQAHYLNQHMPAHQYLLNLHDDRYSFLLGFLLGLLRGSVSLFPPATTPHMMACLQKHYPNTLVLCDDEQAMHGLHYHNIRKDLPETFEQTEPPPRPAIELNTVVAILFTSGSTGEPKPYPKHWQDLVSVAQQLRQRFHLQAQEAILATVPTQHLYGLETAIMLALQAGVALHSRHPFYPEDIREALNECGRATTLITTPVHLRACLQTRIALPHVQRVISATAPLDPSLADAFEQRYDTPVYEIFGCTEVGAIGTRRTTQSAEWLTLADIRVTQRNPEEALLQTSRSIGMFEFNDYITVHQADRFTLQGRKQDMINIAGKRASLAHLNHHLLAIGLVQDGCFYLPAAKHPSTRLVAFVVSQTPEHKAAIVQALKAAIDPIFLPRQVYFVDQLPRNATGKLPLSALDTLYTRLTTAQTHAMQ